MTHRKAFAEIVDGTKHTKPNKTGSRIGSSVVVVSVVSSKTQ